MVRSMDTLEPKERERCSDTECMGILPSMVTFGLVLLAMLAMIANLFEKGQLQAWVTLMLDRSRAGGYQKQTVVENNTSSLVD